MTPCPPRLLRAVAVAAALAVVVTTAGCRSRDLPAGYYGTAVDAERARTLVWTDPWVAPQEATYAGVHYGVGLDRTAGLRETTYAGSSARRIAVTELDGAEAAGWHLVALACEPDALRLVVERGTTVADWARAEVVVRGTTVDVSAAVAHHLDGAVQAEPVLDRADTCLARPGSASTTVAALGDGPIGGTGDDADGPDPSWTRDAPTAEEQATRTTVAGNAFLSAHGIVVSEPRLEARDERRYAPGSLASLPRDGDPSATAAERLAALVDEAGEAGWRLTWASCTPGRAGLDTASATLVLPTAPATLRLDLAGDGPVDARLVLPLADGPDAAWIADVPR